MDKSQLKKKLYSGQTCLGTWVFLPSPDVVEIIGLAGLDFVVIDMEHSPITYQNIVPMIVAAENKGLIPLVRVSELGGSHVLRTLDSGAHGIQIPHIDTAEQAGNVVKYVKYHPQGERGLAPSTRGSGYTLKTEGRLLRDTNQAILIVVSLESKMSLRNLPEIIDVPGIDVIYIGPYDLSQSLGFAGEVEHPTVLKTMERIFAKVRKSNKIAGSFANTVNRARRLKDIGVNYLTCETDGTLLRSAFKNLKDEIMR